MFPGPCPPPQPGLATTSLSQPPLITARGRQRQPGHGQGPGALFPTPNRLQTPHSPAGRHTDTTNSTQTRQGHPHSPGPGHQRPHWTARQPGRTQASCAGWIPWGDWGLRQHPQIAAALPPTAPLSSPPLCPSLFYFFFLIHKTEFKSQLSLPQAGEAVWEGAGLGVR